MWPTKARLRFVENLLYLVPLGPRHAGYNVLGQTFISEQGAKALADATEACWQAIQNQDAVAFGHAVRASFEAQIAMFPDMVTPSIMALIESYRDRALGWKLSGAGGGGYVVLVAEEPIEQALCMYARRQLQ